MDRGDSLSFLDDINEKLKALEKSKIDIQCGTVTSVSPFMVQMAGETNSLEYLRPVSYAPSINDRVYFLSTKSKSVCLGKYV